MKKFFLLFFTLILWAGFNGEVLGQILTFEFSALAGDEVSATSNSNNANLTSSTITRGAGLTASGNSGRYNATSWAITSIANAVSGDDYMEFTITPNSGYQFSVSSIVVQWQRSSTGNTAISLRSSVDGYATDLDAVKPVTDGTSTQTFTWTFTQSNSSTAVTYRLYSYAESTAGSGGPGDGTGNDIVVNGSVSATSSPSITVGPATLTSFSYVNGSGPSSEQSFSISGTNLTDDISITPSTNYEISTETGVDFSATNPITLTETGGTVDETTIYVRLKAGLSSGNYNDEEVTATSADATNKTVACSGTVYKIEPTNHVTIFTSAAGTPDYSAINLSWTDASGGTVPDGYLIKGSDVGYGSITDPVDGTAESDAALIKNIAHGVQTATISGLTASTTYYFKIFPYTNSGSNINYKIDGVVPTTTIGTGSAPAASLLLEENFDFSGALTSNGWTAHSGGGTNVISTTTGLTYTGYANSGTGNAALLSNLGGEDLNRNFTLQNVNGTTIYVSFLVNITEASSNKTGDYFFSLGDRVSPSDFTLFAARVGVKIASDVVNFGISNTSTITYGSTSFAKNTTYLLIVKYTINSGGNDETKLWVFSTGVPSDESSAGSAEVTNTTTAGQDAIDALALRQGSATTSVQLVIDGIRVSDGWGQAPLPVELSSFNAAATNGAVKLTWQTATEVNNYGFQVERKILKQFASGEQNDNDWVEVGFVAGNGNSNAPKDYSYTDNSLDNSGKYSYRLKQIDNDGKTTYSNEIETDVTVVLEYALSQNYPNPFNPATVINYTLSQPGFVTIKIYNTLGQEVSTLLNGQMEAGKHTLTFDASKLSSGMYLYKITAGNFTQVKKMLLAK
ncbi:MAG: T9SS type A sorting domain-containing protein [Ignavibacteria bacterium]|nr:T9SS type A sorting domain-containing protein [Ignavibacteria bacterium]